MKKHAFQCNLGVDDGVEQHNIEIQFLGVYFIYEIVYYCPSYYPPTPLGIIFCLHTPPHTALSSSFGSCFNMIISPVVLVFPLNDRRLGVSPTG